ncbi:MAG: hypothetical protein EU529_06195 [Promethearchaeota archaeon]|nr:MAG: hypothetical protein EU529_06195 [Candidatus Lokiarchaeota archaeon]
MYNPLTISVIIVYFICLIIIIFTIVHVARHHKNFGTVLNSILTIISVFFIGIIYSTLFIFSIIIYLSEYVNLLLWKLSIIMGFVSLEIVILVSSFMIEYKKIPFFPLLCYTILLGFLIGSLFFLESIQIIHKSSNSSPYLVIDTSEINFIFNPLTGLITIIFLTLILINLLYVGIILYFKSREPKVIIGFSINAIILWNPLILYILYIIFQLTVYRELHIIFIMINSIVLCITLIKRPEMFQVLTNKVYFLNIYHKSGILLYSYEFEKEGILTDSVIWGNILIGINHILSEFIDSRDKIDMLQTKKAKIIVNYNNEYGFAVLVISNQKNEILVNLMENFTNDFKDRYKNELMEIQDLNKIIDVSDFKDTREMILKNFKIYL